MGDNPDTPAALLLERESIVTLNNNLIRPRLGLDIFEKGQIASSYWNRDVRDVSGK